MMKMRQSTTRPLAKVRLLGLAVFLAVAGAGCESFLDVNPEPDTFDEARADQVLSVLIVQMVHSTYYGDPGLWGVEWSQQVSYNDSFRDLAEIHHYEVHADTPDFWWSFNFTGMLNETRRLMEGLEPEVDPAYSGIAQFLHAWTWALTTDAWGPVPFSEALDTSILSPSYDPQPVVYDGIMRMFDEAVETMEMSGATIVSGPEDPLFNGDIARWIKLARTVQARHHLRLSSAPWADQEEQAQAALDALSEGFASNNDDAEFRYPEEEQFQSPLVRYDDVPHLFKASAFLVELLQERDDPRLPIMVEPALADLEGGEVVYRGHENGSAEVPESSVSQLGADFIAEDASLNLASYADARFTEAEARLILSGPDAADGPYREGIRANMEKWGVASEEIEAYLNARPPLGAVEDPLAEIIREKYVVNFLKIEPWNDWRRTGHPELEPVPGRVIDGIPVRLRTPRVELNNNSDNVGFSGVPTGADGMLWESPEVWWGGV